MNKRLFIKVLLVVALLIPSKIFAEGIKINCGSDVYPGSTVSCQIFLDSVSYGVDTFEATIALSNNDFSIVSYETVGFGNDVSNNKINDGYSVNKTNNDLLGTLNVKVSDNAEVGSRCMVSLSDVNLVSDESTVNHAQSAVTASLLVKAKPTPDPDNGGNGGGNTPSGGGSETPEPDDGGGSGNDNGGSSDNGGGSTPSGGGAVIPKPSSGGNSTSGSTSSNGAQTKATSNPSTGVASVLAITVLMVVALYGAYHFFMNTKKENNQ